MAEKIDELQLGISSDAQSAIDQLGRLANALGKAAEKADLLSQKASGINNFATGLKSLADTDTEKLKAVTSRLRSLSKIDLSNIADKNLDIGVSVNGGTDAVSDIKDLTTSLKQLKSSSGGTKASLGNSTLGIGLKAGLQGASTAAKTLFSWTMKLGGQGVSALGSFMGKLGLIPHHAQNVDRMSLSFGNLLRTILPFVSIRGVFGWLKEATELGSSIVEIQNVIDVAFGDLKKGYDSVAGHIYNWSKTTMDAFGVSEIAALRYAGRLQSIFNSSGFDVSESMRNSASQMTTDLIERAGDIASFYDISADEAMTKMQAGLVGMVRPLRALGVNMSVANMEAFAMSQGIETSWKEMDQASQMALRYQYILSATQYAAGDFQRTEMSLANQTRLLTMNFQVLSTTIGQGLVSAIAPVIAWLNALIKRLIQAATAFRTFMWTLFGKPIAAAKGVADDLLGSLDDSADAVGDLGGGAGGASDGLGKAGKAAKELKKQLTVLPFDELNQLAKDTDSASSGGSGGSGGGGGVGGLGGLDTDSLLPDFESEFADSPVVQAINRWAARIREAFEKHQWKNLGRIVADGINTGFEYIYDALDWNKIKPKVVDGFITPFQEAFNSFMLWIDWPLIGRTFGRGLNDITYTLRAWITGFNWREYGGYFAEGMNGFLDEWDSEEFGRLIADKFKMAWDIFGGWVGKFDFKEFGGKLKELIKGGIDELDPWQMGKDFAGFFNGLADVIIGFLEDGSVKSDVAHAFSQFVNGFIEDLDEDDIAYAMSLLKDTIVGGIGQALSEINTSELGGKLADILAELPWGTIGIIIGLHAGASLAAGIFGTAFKLKAASILTGMTFGGGGTAGATGATGAGGAASALGGTVAGLTVSQLAIIGGVSVGGVALGLWLKKQADESGLTKLFQLGDEGSKKKSVQSVGEGQTKNQQILNKQGMTGAGTYTSIQTVKLKGETDSSYKELIAEKLALHKDPVVTKTLKGKEDDTYKVMAKDYLSVATTSATKTALGTIASTFRTTKTEYNSIGTTTITKTGSGAIASAFNTMKNVYNGVYSNTATKTANGIRTGAFDTVWDRFTDLVDKWITAHIDVETNAKKVVASMANGAVKTVAELLTIYNAKGGLFTGPTGFQVFGEAGAEAAIPLERKSTMKRIASAIVDSGGMATSNSDEIADAIAMRVLPAIASMMDSMSQRPINNNVTVYTENNEVLARAVNQGNRSLDKRYNPVAQFSY